jgi:hypothetical protein
MTARRVSKLTVVLTLLAMSAGGVALAMEEKPQAPTETPTFEEWQAREHQGQPQAQEAMVQIYCKTIVMPAVDDTVVMANSANVNMRGDLHLWFNSIITKYKNQQLTLARTIEALNMLVGTVNSLTNKARKQQEAEKASYEQFAKDKQANAEAEKRIVALKAAREHQYLRAADFSKTDGEKVDYMHRWAKVGLYDYVKANGHFKPYEKHGEAGQYADQDYVWFSEKSTNAPTASQLGKDRTHGFLIVVKGGTVNAMHAAAKDIRDDECEGTDDNVAMNFRLKANEAGAIGIHGSSASSCAGNPTRGPTSGIT